MKIITSKNILEIGFETLFKNALKFLEEDLLHWDSFKKSPRHAIHYKHGVFELMPCADDKYYTYKYVNAHPANPSVGKLSIVATGMLADIETGYPQLFCDMTLLTAIRTAATSAIAAKYFAKKDSTKLGLIGTGAQSEFQVRAMQEFFDIKTIFYFDRDEKAMQKFASNFKEQKVKLVKCNNAEEVVSDIDILTTCICEKKHVKLFDYNLISENKHLFINAIGGDCPGKTELDPQIIENSRIIVEFYEQTKHEGEIQNLDYKPAYDELHEVVEGKKAGRTDSDEIIVFDSVGFALADYSMMRMLNKLSIGGNIEILPKLENPKNLFSSFTHNK